MVLVIGENPFAGKGGCPEKVVSAVKQLIAV